MSHCFEASNTYFGTSDNLYDCQKLDPSEGTREQTYGNVLEENCFTGNTYSLCENLIPLNDYAVTKNLKQTSKYANSGCSVSNDVENKKKNYQLE